MKLLLRISEFQKRSDRGATSIEYALIAVGIFLVIIVGTGAIGTSLRDVFTQVSGGFPS